MEQLNGRRSSKVYIAVKTALKTGMREISDDANRPFSIGVITLQITISVIKFTKFKAKAIVKAWWEDFWNKYDNLTNMTICNESYVMDVSTK